MQKYIKYSKEVEDAIKNNLPIVALESTIISHGMPYPENLETAINCEKIIKENGCVPATIAIIEGKICIGLEKEELEYLAKAQTKVTKTSRRDIPVIISQKLSGATTVSATMYLASLAKIKLFATGGIGGVHKKAELTMDISADLEELANTDVCVVCAGPKAILDLAKTLEYLETKGVPVIGYQTNKLPAFYTKSSNYNVDYQMNSPEEIAKMIKVKWDLQLKGGILVTNPIPNVYSLDENIINDAIEKALIEAEKLNINGKNITPFLLDKIKTITNGESLKSNIQLVYNNCLLASLIAKAYYEI